MMRSLLEPLTFVASVVALAACLSACQETNLPSEAVVSPASATTRALPTEGSAEILSRGAYLATVGNCSGCHTAPGGAPYAGGKGLPTPFGTVYPGNLTRDAQTGLGTWTADDFWQALHHGRSRGGRRLLPAFPYTSYTNVRREDSDALFAYLQSLPAVKQPNKPHGLRFPYNTAVAMAVWQWLYFRPADPAPASLDSNPVSRGAYLVNGLGHCAACHAARNALGAPDSDARGGEMPGEPWFAPTLHPSSNKPTATGDIVQLLRSGLTDHASVSGPMAAVVFQSTQHWTDADLRATAAYLSSLPPAQAQQPEAADDRQLRTGEKVYADNCADCHGKQGEGRPSTYPALAGNSTVQHPSARNIVQLMRHGSFGPSTRTNPLPYSMPHQGLSNAEMAAVATYVRQSWGNRASAISEIDVMHLQ